MGFITVYDEHGTDHFVNVDHIVRVSYSDGRNPPRLHLILGVIYVYGTPTCPVPSPNHEVHQDIIDQITAASPPTTHPPTESDLAAHAATKQKGPHARPTT